MNNMVEEQATDVGDALHESTYDLPEDDAAEQEENPAEEKSEEDSKKSDADYAKERKSDKEWQSNKEKAEKFDALMEKLGGDEESKEEDPLEAVQRKLEANEKEVELIREESKRKDFERNYPATVNEKYEAEWKKACKDKLDPDHKYNKLDYEEIWKLIKREDPKVQQAKKELEKSESNPFDGSVPQSGTQVEDLTSNDAQSETKNLMIEHLGYGEEDFK